MSTGVGKAAGMFLLGLVSAAAIWEIANRTFLGVQPPLVKFKPGGQFYDGKLVQSDEGYSTTHFKGTGFRSPIPHGQHRHRVLALGDSYTEAIQVADNEAFPARTQALLQAAGVDAVCFNAGVSGGAPPRYIALAPYYKETIDPDAVAILLNDTDFTADYLDRAHNFAAVKEGDGYKLVVLPSTKKQKILQNPLVEKAFRLSLVQKLARKASAGGGGDAAVAPAKPGKSVKPNDEEIRRYIEWCVDQMAAVYPNLVLFYAPNMDYFHPEKPGLACEAILTQVCQEKGVKLFNMREAYNRQFAKDGRFSNGFINTQPGKGHINALGHELIAQELARELSARYTKP